MLLVGLTVFAAGSIAAMTATDAQVLIALRAVIGLGFVVARADGRVAQSERKAIRAYLDQVFGHDPVLVRNILLNIPTKSWLI